MIRKILLISSFLLIVLFFMWNPSDNNTLEKNLTPYIYYAPIKVETENNKVLIKSILREEFDKKKEFFDLDAKIIMDYIKHLPIRNEQYIEEVQVKYYDHKNNHKPIYEVMTKKKTLYSTDWTNVNVADVENAVDYYYIKNQL